MPERHILPDDEPVSDLPPPAYTLMDETSPSLDVESASQWIQPSVPEVQRTQYNVNSHRPNSIQSTVSRNLSYAPPRESISSSDSRASSEFGSSQVNSSRPQSQQSNPARRRSQQPPPSLMPHPEDVAQSSGVAGPSSQSTNSSLTHDSSSGGVRASRSPSMRNSPGRGVHPLPPLPSAPPPQPVAPDRSSSHYDSASMDQRVPIVPKYLYYQVFENSAPLILKTRFDPEDDTLGRVLARQIAPPKYVSGIKQCIAQLESIPIERIGDLYLDSEAGDEPLADNFRVSFADNGGFGLTPELPLSIILRSTSGFSMTGLVSNMATASISDVHLPSPVSPNPPPLSLPPSIHERQPSPDLPPLPPPAIALTSPTPSAHYDYDHGHASSLRRVPSTQAQPPMSIASQHSPLLGPISVPPPISPSVQTQVPAQPPNHNTTPEFEEPEMSLTEVGRVMNSRRPVGWTSGKIRCVGSKPFMGKVKRDKIANSGIALRDDMIIWVDTRVTKTLTMKKDVFKTYRCIIPASRDVVYLWTGDVAFM